MVVWGFNVLFSSFFCKRKGNDTEAKERKGRKGMGLVGFGLTTLNCAFGMENEIVRQMITENEIVEK